MVEELIDAWGILLRRDALAAGYHDNKLARQVRAHRIIRIRQGAYADAERWSQETPVGRHLMLCRAVMRQYGDTVALSHASATARRGGPTWRLDLTDVHLTSLVGVSERRAARIVHHRGNCRVGDITRFDGDWITAGTRSALDTAATARRDAGVCVLDWYLNRGLTTREELELGLAGMKEWPGTLSLLRRLQLCDGRSESVGETRTRLLAHDQGLPAPELQWVVRHPNGRVAGRADFAWPRFGLLGEFDGRAKYGRYLRPGESVTDAVLREKAREDLLRELTGWRMIRLVWEDLARPFETAERIRYALGRAVA